MKSIIFYKSIILILAVCIAFCFYKLKNCSQNIDSTEVVINNIMNRKSVRSYTNQKIDNQILENIVKAGMAAPTARNLQPWEFVVVTDRNVLDKLSTLKPAAKMLQEATAAIVVAGNLDTYTGDLVSVTPYWVQDTSAATENMLLAVEAYKLGAVWIGVYPTTELTSKVQEMLSLPNSLVPLNIISIGYPKDNTLPKDKFKPTKLHWNTYTSK